MDARDLIGAWRLTEYTIKANGVEEKWDKEGLMLFTESGFVSISVNYTGNIKKDFTKQTTNRVIRDYFTAGRYNIVDNNCVEIDHHLHSLPERIGWKEKRSYHLSSNLLTEIICRNNLEMVVLWEKL